MDPFGGLLTPLALRGVTLANRIVMSPMTRERSPAGVPTDEVASYYARRAAAGVGLIVSEGVAVDHPAAVDAAAVPRLHDEAVTGWAQVTASVHAAGAPMVAQLWHQGILFDAGAAGDLEVRRSGPSGVWGPPAGLVSLPADQVARLARPFDPMTDEDIAEVIAAYSRSARAAVRAGFDGVALHGAHGYLIDSFLWSGTNLRNDRWGGSLSRRSAFAVEVVRAVRAEIGEERPLFFRFSQFKMQDYKALLGSTPDELGALLAPLAEAGVDVFDGSQRYFDTPIFEGSSLNLAGWAKALTGRLTMTVGGIGLDQGRKGQHLDTSAQPANNLEKLIARFEAGEFDLAAVGRALLNDPEWLGRLRRGEAPLPFDAANLNRLT